MNPGTKLDIQTGTYFSGAFYYLGLAMILPGIILARTGHPLMIVPFLLATMITLTTHRALEIDISAKCYREYVWVLGLEFGSRIPFERVEYVFIKRNKESQTIHSQIKTRNLQYDVYDGFVRFSEKDKIHLATARSKEILLKKVLPIAKVLGVDILDYSEAGR